MMKKHVPTLARRLTAAAAVLALSLGAAGQAGAQAAFAPLVDVLDPVQGQSFTLWWIDERLPAGGSTSFTAGDIYLAYDPAALQLTQFAPGSIFNGATVVPISESVPRSQYGYLDGLAVAAFAIDGGNPLGAATDQDVASFSFTVLGNAPVGASTVYLLPDQVAVQAGFGAPAYYAFDSAAGYAVAIQISAVPEPSALALMLAGLVGVTAVATAARGRRQQPVT